MGSLEGAVFVKTPAGSKDGFRQGFAVFPVSLGSAWSSTTAWQLASSSGPALSHQHLPLQPEIRRGGGAPPRPPCCQSCICPWKQRQPTGLRCRRELPCCGRGWTWLRWKEVHRQGGDGGGDGVRRRGAVRPLLRQEVPHHLHHQLRVSAGGGLRGELQEELLHRVRADRLQRDCHRLQDSSGEGL